MNILVFTYSITRAAGGVFDAVRELFTNTAFSTHNLNVISFRDEYCDMDVSQWNGLPIQLFDAGILLYSSKAKQALLNANADILHMEALWRCPQLWMTDWKKRYANRPIVCSPHGMLDPYIIQSQGRFKRMISNLFFQKGLEAVDCYHALCQKELEDIRTYGLRQPVAIIPNGINLPNTTKSFKRKDNKKHLLYLGRLHKKKGVDMLLTAIIRIKTEKPNLLADWHIDIVGWNHENCQAELERIVHEGHLEEQVTFHGGLFGDDKLRMYATSDAYILPSHGEGLPMTILEAWSWKLPVVMTSKCNIPEGFEANAALRIDDTIESVKQGLIKLLSMNPEQRKNIGVNGYQLVKEKFTWDASAKKMIQLYAWLFGNASKPSFVFE
ncbi:glycosyltransferase [uncultured Phocaeicola sp.]|uniref:glycosyltransferase n=1 Tax=uncultured Phocaeicola sp. TaxID=990718 RepID=UPI0025F5361F|nr:glycosyltransferase [uncultured Phocaeicola sp.]